MTVQWPISKLDLVNRALAVTGNNLVNVLEDGSDEYNVCSPAYEDALAVMLEEHGWVHATKVTAALAASPLAPADAEYDTAYSLPADLLHLIWVKLDDAPAAYTIVGGQVWVQSVGGGTLSIKYVSTDNSDPTAGTPLFVRALTLYVTSAIYRGLHGDQAEAAQTFRAAEAMAQRARTRSDQQKPRRSFWNSRLAASRRMPRPWPSG